MRTSIIFAALGIIFLASACDGSLRVHPVDVQVDHRYDDCRDHHNGCRDWNDHRGDDRHDHP
jgi:hypothetical protein